MPATGGKSTSRSRGSRPMRPVSCSMTSNHVDTVAGYGFGGSDTMLTMVAPINLGHRVMSMGACVASTELWYDIVSMMFVRGYGILRQIEWSDHSIRCMSDIRALTSKESKS